MAESNLPKQDFAPPWLKFPTADSSKTPSQNGYQSERNRQRREDPYHSRSEYNRLHRQTSFDFHDAKRYPQGQGKFRHHSIDDEYYSNPYGGYGYYASSYNYEKLGMQYTSQPSLAQSVNRDAKHAPGRLSQGPAKRGYYEKEQHKDSRDVDAKGKERSSDRDKPFSEDFPLLKGSGENTPDSKQTKPAGSGVWDNPPRSSRNEDSPELLKPTSPGLYKALVLSKNGQMRKNGSEAVRVNGRNSNKPNYKEGARHSPTSDLAIVTQPKKLGDKKSEFLRALRNESNIRNGDSYQDFNQNSTDKKQATKETDESPMNESVIDYSSLNGSGEHKGQNGSRKILVNENKKVNCHWDQQLREDCSVNGETLVKHVDQIYLSGEEEEKRLLESMGWSEEDQTEYVITDDDVKEFHHMLNRVREQTKLGNPSRCGILRLKLGTHFANCLLNGTYYENDEYCKQESL